ncbi:hypothetical protein HK096_003413 [Nowakowskiella sp. JEL0078]|nr:hypothetical protein HK096_003413 [Nowakowskiella sp. JEL0078]
MAQLQKQKTLWRYLATFNLWSPRTPNLTQVRAYAKVAKPAKTSDFFLFPENKKESINLKKERIEGLETAKQLANYRNAAGKLQNNLQVLVIREQRAERWNEIAVAAKKRQQEVSKQVELDKKSIIDGYSTVEDIYLKLPQQDKVLACSAGIVSPSLLLESVAKRGNLNHNPDNVLFAVFENNELWDISRPFTKSGDVNLIGVEDLHKLMPSEKDTNPVPQLISGSNHRIFNSIFNSAAFVYNWALECVLDTKAILVDYSTSTSGFYCDIIISKSNQNLALEIADSLNSKVPPVGNDSLEDFRALFEAANTHIHQILNNSQDFTGLSDKLRDQVNEVYNTLCSQRAPISRQEVTWSQAVRMFAANPFKLALLSSYPTSAIFPVYRAGNHIELFSNTSPTTPDTALVANTIHALYLETNATSAAQFVATSQPETPFTKAPASHVVTRVHGIAFPTSALLRLVKEVALDTQKRDHRIIGKQLGLFLFHPYSPGSATLLPHGTRVASRLVDMLRKEYRRFGFMEVSTPLMFNKALWEQSGHWEHYRDDMFRLGVDETEFALKPMNCPGHCLIFGAAPRTRKELPMRIAEFSPLHRNEASGALSGLSRVRKFSQDDAHIFCLAEHTANELDATLRFVERVYGNVLRLPYNLALSTRPTKIDGEATLGDDGDWTRAESELTAAVERTGKAYTTHAGDGAFYGPKIDIVVRDAIGREHQTATVQLDFQLPRRFGLQFEGEDIVLVHRAVLGSVERMLALLTEHFGGRWPFWLSPRQAVVLATSPAANEYATWVAAYLSGRTTAKFGEWVEGEGEMGVERFVELNDNTESLSKKVAQASSKKVNFAVVVGEKEMADGVVTLRNLRKEERGVIMGVDEVLRLWEGLEKRFE